MGGLVCAIRRNAVLKFETVPAAPAQLRQFDEQMRTLLTAPGIAEAIVEETTRGQEVCDILAKPRWVHADRMTLLDIVEAIYEA